MVQQDLLTRVAALAGASAAHHEQHIQSLWSGYGELFRVRLEGTAEASAIVKWVRPPTQADHPRGWNSDRSHQRKLRSYEVELHWYQQWSALCDGHCRVPRRLGGERRDDAYIFVLEDLDAAGFCGRRQQLTQRELAGCLAWLAAFHARFLGREPEGLWPTGTYWHLATRPDELAAIDDPELRRAAPLLDRKLCSARFSTLVHGDAKVANFCFSPSTEGSVAAVDFQYVGGGCGMKDVAYFLGSCLHESDCERLAPGLLDLYFARLQEALAREGQSADFEPLQAEWRELYPVAWADFHRFLSGWAPGHWKLHGYTERMTRKALQTITG